MYRGLKNLGLWPIAHVRTHVFHWPPVKIASSTVLCWQVSQCFAFMPNPSINPDRWRGRLFLRYASAPFGVSGIVLQVNPHVGHSCPHPPMVISPCPLGHSPLRMRKSLSMYRSLSPGFPPSTSIRSGSARSISIFSPFKTRITQRSFGPARKAAQSAQLSVSRH